MLIDPSSSLDIDSAAESTADLGTGTVALDQATRLHQQIAQLRAIDTPGFLAELRQLRSEIDSQLGEADLLHLRKIENWGRLATLIGVLTAWICPNPLSMIALALGRNTRWLLMHHIGHRGYDRVPGVPKRYTSRFFARGWRRYVDWPDWLTPEAWKQEHNVLHHSHTGEDRDPDLLERNTSALRNSGLPMPLRTLLICLLGLIWKPAYFLPSALHGLHSKEPKGPAGELSLDRESKLEMVFDGYLPYLLLQFVMFPALYLLLGPWFAFSALINSLGAELLCNLHMFLVISPSHTGPDVWRFDGKPVNKSERTVRQVIGSVNYLTGGDRNDYLHLWLNYQIEHHIWPDLPMLKYQQIQPRVEALCAKYGVPYLQEDLFTRFRKMLAVTTGRANMLNQASDEGST